MILNNLCQEKLSGPPLRCPSIDCNSLKAQAAQQAIHSCAKIQISCLAQTSVILWEKLTTVHSHTERKEITPQKEMT